MPDAHLEQFARGPMIRPNYLTSADYPWLTRLIVEATLFLGCKRAEFVTLLHEPLPFTAPKSKLQAAVAALIAGAQEASLPQPEPRLLRQKVFFEAAKILSTASSQAAAPLASPAYRAAICHNVLSQEENHDQNLISHLYDDLPDERRVQRLGDEVTPASLAIAANGQLLQHHLRHSFHLTLYITGEARRMVRIAQLRGLICQAVPAGSQTRLEISGAFSIIRKTAYYRRAFLSLIPHLGWANRYLLIIYCKNAAASWRVALKSGDPLPSASLAPSCDSKLEQKFLEDFKKKSKNWHLIHEPAPLEIKGDSGQRRFIFPDFAAVHKLNPSERWLIEIVGYYTPQYLSAKKEALRKIKGMNFILCLDERFKWDEGDFAGDMKIVTFKKNRIRVEEVLAVLGEVPSCDEEGMNGKN
jgi:predicted nuclease of restriction endonuclease-like RecB superfamily